MSASLETVRRLNAWAIGEPLARGNVINMHVADDEDLFIVSFLRMGGESRPWGVAYGTIADGPTVLTVPEGRNRQLVADMMAAFAPAILGHFRHPSYSEDHILKCCISLQLHTRALRGTDQTLQC